ncbi:MAG: TRAP transporter permease [Halodesulfurarchaeum sp.]|nr:TRAP transporter permease [Halodesulfurarchaeum sp.]
MTETEPPTDETPVPDSDEIIQKLQRKRSVAGWLGVLVAAIGISFSVFQVMLAAKSFYWDLPLPIVGEIRLVGLQLLQANAVHVSFALVLTFLLYPPTTGEGIIVRSFGRLYSILDELVGGVNPMGRALEAVRGGIRWAFFDPDQERLTPIDVVLSIVAALAAIYFLAEFSEIQNIRLFGLSSGVPFYETFPFEPLFDALPFLEFAIGVIPGSEFPYAFFLGIVGVFLVLEATRRTIGLPLMLIVAGFIVYARWGYMIPADTPYVGVLSIPELSWQAIVQNLWYNTENGVFGIPVTVSVQFIYIFILFGAFLEKSGAGQWFIDLAYAGTGTRTGGPAKASILASGFMGTISGSSIANTVTTGTFTIPLMKRSGYDAEFSGAVEAAASSGGQILPPVMGAAAFLIVQYTATPFADVIVVATIPAIVFFFGVWVMVHLKAVQSGVGGLDASELVDVGDHLRRGWFYLAPIGLLLYYLIIERLSVGRSAWYTILSIAALIALVAAYNDDTRRLVPLALLGIAGLNFVSMVLFGADLLGLVITGPLTALSPADAFGRVLGNLGWYAIIAAVLVMGTRPMMRSPLLSMDPDVQKTAKNLSGGIGRPSLEDNQLFRYVAYTGNAMESGARTAVPVVIAVAAAGVIPGVISVSGLGPNLVSLITELAAGSLVLMLLMTAVASIILGMGMPTTVTYIILVSLLGPALVAFGIAELAAHLFILYFGVIADITPPVAVAAYAASGVAQSDAFETGVKAFSLSLNKAIVPFAFILSPGILLLRTGVSVPGSDKTYRVLTGGDLTELGFVIPEVVLPVIGLFLGVYALGPTVIGHLSAPLSRLSRAAFALSAFLLMAPGLFVTSLSDALSVVGLGPIPLTPTLDIGLRAIGLVLFVLLYVRDRRTEWEGPANRSDGRSAEGAA